MPLANCLCLIAVGDASGWSGWYSVAVQIGEKYGFNLNSYEFRDYIAVTLIFKVSYYAGARIIRLTYTTGMFGEEYGDVDQIKQQQCQP